MRENYKKTEYYEMWLENDIMHFIYAKYINININIAKTIVLERVKFSQGRDWPILVILNNVSIDHASKTYFANEGIQNIKALAILANNPLDVLIATIFVRCTGFPIPLKIFSNKNKALSWLDQYIENTNSQQAMPLFMTS